MKIIINISKLSCQALQKPLALYNQWPYRCADATLTESLFKIELADFPIFWEQFMKHLPSLKKVMRTDSLNAMRELSEENAGPSLKKALEVLS